MDKSGQQQSGPGVGRFELARDAVVFQVKLAVDGFRDLLLIPVSLIAAAISFLGGGREFYDVVRFGKRTERWIDLFSAAEHDQPKDDVPSIDEMVAQVESYLRSETNQGRVIAARESLERLLRNLRERQQSERTDARGGEPRQHDT